jgi:outer membrane receptor for ferrienterochelin and colicins
VLYKLDPKGRDQVRLSLTRSYRPPQAQNLITQPRINTTGRPNSATNPDRAGNPNLRPELATGVDLAVERYLPGSGMLSVNLFHRRITDYMRRGDPVRATPADPYIARMENVGMAITQGIETEAKFRASDVWEDAPRVDLRANVSAFRSRVLSVPGPDNRLDQQPGCTANFGADYRLPGTPLTIGGNLNYTPGYTTRLTDQSTALIGKKRVGDVYALWRFPSGIQLRATASNVAPHDSINGSTFDNTDPAVMTRTRSQTVSDTSVNWQLRLEMRL